MINLPCCSTLTYQGHPMSTAQYFHAPQVKKMIMNSHDIRSQRVQQRLCELDGKIPQLHTLHLTLQCSEKVLFEALRYMEPLQELVLSIAYTSLSWANFLELLVAKPSTRDWKEWKEFQYGKPEWKRWCSSQTWHALCLKYMGIHSSKGLFRSQCFDNCPLLRLVGWTRARRTPPLEHLEVWEGRGTEDDILVDYISTGYLDKHLGTSGEGFDRRIVQGMAARSLWIHDRATLLFKQLHSTILFRYFLHLDFCRLDDDIHILPYLEQIKDLKVQRSRILAYSPDIDLPLIHTFQRLVLDSSPFRWMLGRTFKALNLTSTPLWPNIVQIWLHRHWRRHHIFGRSR